LANGIEQMARDSSPEYSDALDQFANDSNYIDGHAHGLTGKTVGQTQDPGLIKALASPDGQAGYQSGITTRLANTAFAGEGGASTVGKDIASQAGTAANLGKTFRPVQVDALRDAAGAETAAADSLRALAPTTPAPAATGAGVRLAMAAAELSRGRPVAAMYHGIRALPGLHMSDNVARITAGYLTDPSMAQQGINLMARGGINETQTRAPMQKFAVPGAIAAAVAGQ